MVLPSTWKLPVRSGQWGGGDAEAVGGDTRLGQVGRSGLELSQSIDRAEVDGIFHEYDCREEEKSEGFR